LLRSKFMAEEAVNKHGLSALTCFRDAADPVAALQAELEMRPLDPAALTVEMRFVASRPDDAERVLKALLAASRTILGEAVGKSGEEQSALIRKARDELLELAQEKEKALAAFRASLPKEWPGRTELAERRTRLAQLELERDELLRTLVPLRSRLAAADDASAAGDQATLSKLMRPAAPAAAAVAVAPTRTGAALIDLLAEEATLLKTYGERHPKVREIRARIDALQPEFGGETPLSKLRAQERILLESFGPDHPKVREVRAKIGELDGPATKSSSRPTSGDIDPPPSDAGRESSSDFIASLRSELAVRDREARELEKLIAERRQDIHRWGESESGEENLSRDVDRTRRLYETVLEQLKVSTKPPTSRSAGIVVLSQPKAGVPVHRNPLSALLIGGGCGAFVGLLLKWAQVKTGRGMNRPERPTLGEVPILAHLQAPDTAAAPIAGDLHPTLQVYLQPQSPVAETYRSLRTIMRFRGEQIAAKHFGLLDSSVGPSGLIIAANLAASFALTGKRTLLIDCGNGPLRAHQIFAVKPAESLDDALNDRKELVDALQTTEIPDLEIAEWRPLSVPMPTDRYHDAIQALREKYELTVVSLPAANDDRMTAAAELVDCFVLLSQPNGSAEGLLAGMERLPEFSKSRILGAVVYGAEA